MDLEKCMMVEANETQLLALLNKFQDVHVNISEDYE